MSELKKGVLYAAIFVATFALVAALPGCATVSDASTKLPVQYATLKLIEQSDQIGPSDVISHVRRVRALTAQDTELSTADLVTQVLAGIDTDALEVSDRLLLMALVGYVADSLGEVNLISSDHKLSLLTLLDWVEQAARLAE